MATAPSPKLETAQAEARPEHSKFSKLTPEYRKAHKNYVLVAGLLGSWELIGIDPTPLGDKWGIHLLSPQGIPLILYTLLVYSAYKVIIEWNPEDDPRPKSTRARIDYYLAHIIATIAVGIGLVQYLLKIRIVDILTSRQKSEVFYFALLSAVVGSFGGSERVPGNRPQLFIIGLGTVILMSVVLALAGWRPAVWSGTSCAAGVLLAGIIKQNARKLVNPLKQLWNAIVEGSPSHK